MKITVIGSHLCPDTMYALYKLKEMDADINFINISASLPDLKAYLKVREAEPQYEAVRSGGGIGIPFFELEDGTKTLDLEAAMNKL